MISAVVMAHPKSIIEGEDPRLTVIKKDKLLDFINDDHLNDQLSEQQVNQIALKFATHSLG